MLRCFVRRPSGHDEWYYESSVAGVGNVVEVGRVRVLGRLSLWRSIQPETNAKGTDIRLRLITD